MSVIQMNAGGLLKNVQRLSIRNLLNMMRNIKRICKNRYLEYKINRVEGKGMKVYKIRSFEEYAKHSVKNSLSIHDHNEFLKKYTPKTKGEFRVPGYSYTAGKQVDFIVDYQHSGDGIHVNWRERVCCPETYFNNRMRATFHLFDISMEAYPDSDIYITEQITPIYTYFKNKYPKTVGSEFLGDRCTFGSLGANGVRNETLTALTFESESFDVVVSLDVLEHVPDYMAAFRECARVLRPGGKMMWSVPFVPNSATNLVRAKIENGEVIHILPAEYHGDPLSTDGVLCFQHFGWEMFGQMRDAGFSDAYAFCYQSTEFGYLGGEQFMFVAVK